MPGSDRASLFPPDPDLPYVIPSPDWHLSPPFFRTSLSLIIFAAPDLALYRHTRLCSDVHVMPSLDMASLFHGVIYHPDRTSSQRRTTKRHNSLRHTTKTLFHTPKPHITQRISPLPAASRIIPHMNNISTV